MKILLVTGKLPTGTMPGTLAPVRRQIESLKPLVSQIHILEIEGPSFLKYIKAIGKIRKYSRDFDLVHAHYGLCGFSSVLGSLRPVILSLMGSDILASAQSPGLLSRVRQFIEHKLSRFAARRAIVVIVKSKEMASEIMPIPTVLLPNGVDMELFCDNPRAEARELLGWDKSDIYVLFGGNPEDVNKNYQLATAAVKHAEHLLECSIKIIPLASISPARVPVLLNGCDCMILASLKEGSPNVVKEALACNTPVVSVRVGDVCSILDSTLGCYTCKHDAIDMGEKIDKVLRKKVKIDGRKALTAKGLNSEIVASQLFEIYSNSIKIDL